MSGAPPDEIWEQGLDEGERRMSRGWTALAATGLAGGADVMFGLLAVVVTTAALDLAMPEQTAHVLGSLTFGIALAFITIGRAELFTENFLIPVGAVFSGRAPIGSLLRMWDVTFVLNAVGLALFAAFLAVEGVLESGSLEAAGKLSDTQVERGFLAALLSAVVAGAVMTLFTWVAAAADGSTARILAALLAGFLLIAPSLNHAVVSLGEMLLGLFANTTHGGWDDLLRITAIAILGNVLGGVGIVFATRLAQVRGEPDSRSGSSKDGR
jgi:formate/nitrite transporter FocA (FNT family)